MKIKLECGYRNGNRTVCVAANSILEDTEMLAVVLTHIFRDD